MSDLIQLPLQAPETGLTVGRGTPDYPLQKLEPLGLERLGIGYGQVGPSVEIDLGPGK